MKRILIIVIITMLITTFTMSCMITHRTGDGGIIISEKQKVKKRYHRRINHRYRYYYDCDIYYDIGRKLYFYSDKGRWKMSIDLPSYGCIRFNNYKDYVIIDMDTAWPHERHHKVKKQHPGKREGHYKRRNLHKRW